MKNEACGLALACGFIANSSGSFWPLSAPLGTPVGLLRPPTYPPAWPTVDFVYPQVVIFCENRQPQNCFSPSPMGTRGALSLINPASVCLFLCHGGTTTTTTTTTATTSTTSTTILIFFGTTQSPPHSPAPWGNCN